MKPRVSRAAGGATPKSAPFLTLAFVVSLSSWTPAPLLATVGSPADSQAVRQVARIIRIELKPKAQSHVLGKDAELELRLVDASGKAIKAPKDLKITVEAKAAGAEVLSRTVTVEKDETSE